MSRPITKVQLSNCEVDIIEYLTWGEKEKIEGSMYKNVKVDNSGLKGIDENIVLDTKYKLLEICIKQIKTGEVVTQFTREWMDNLRIEDGDKLYDAVDQLTKKKDVA